MARKSKTGNGERRFNELDDLLRELRCWRAHYVGWIARFQAEPIEIDELARKEQSLVIEKYRLGAAACDCALVLLEGIGDAN